MKQVGDHFEFDLSPGSADVLEIPSSELVDSKGEPISVVDYLRTEAQQTSGLYFDSGSRPITHYLGLTDEQGIQFMAGLAEVVEQMRTESQ